MRFAFFATSALLFLISTGIHAKEYGSYNLKQLFTVSETPSGKKYGIDGSYLDRVLDDLLIHAMNYPPRFDNAQDRQRATRDVSTLSGMLDIMVNGSDVSPELLLRAGLLNSIGYNLDVPGAPMKTSAIFQKLLTISPSHPRGNYLYGNFLAGASKFKDAIPYLEKAIALGIVEAEYTLGMTYMNLGDKQRAIENLESYRNRNPNDPNTSKLIEGIRNSKLEIHQNPMKEYQNQLKEQALNETDSGTYAVIDSKGQVTSKVFRVLQRGSEWIVEDKKTDDSWVEVTCETDCKMNISTENDVQRFFHANVFAEIVPTCIHNMAFAFCTYTLKKNQTFRGYLFVALTEKPSIVFKLARLASGKNISTNPTVSKRSPG